MFARQLEASLIAALGKYEGKQLVLSTRFLTLVQHVISTVDVFLVLVYIYM